MRLMRAMLLRRRSAKPRIKKAVKASVDAEEAAVAEVVAATEQKAE